MPVRLASKAASDGGSTHDAGVDGAPWTCSFVNNMPDGAFEATERQFLGLLEAASEGMEIVVRRHTMDGVPRGEAVAARIAEGYVSVAGIPLDAPDMLIVTGSNPIEAQIRDEPYWEELVGLLTWGRDHVPSMLLSCLSAHAALTVFDGIERVRLPTKRTGVFNHVVDVSHPLGASLTPQLLLPHSRMNTVPEEALEDAGYDVVIHSEMVGWGVASRVDGGCEIVLVQGHPEYDPSSLLREYHRDVRRYVHHERNDLPILPLHCTAQADWGLLEQIHHTIIDGNRDPTLIDTYPFDEVGARAPWPWRETAERFYANWLGNATARAR